MSTLDLLYPKDRITLREVGLRDGLQLVKKWPGTLDKLAWIAAEADAGVQHFEIGSFLPDSRFPQFADIRHLIDAISQRQSSYSAALVLNERGLSDAMATSLDEIFNVVSATEEHSQANVGRSRKEAINLVRRSVQEAAKSDPKRTVSVGISMAFGCSISGAVDPSEVIRVAEACLSAGADTIALADTVGFAGPKQVSALCREMERLCGDRPFIVHFHDTRGLGLANAAAALNEGVRILDASLGGLGGCPFAPGATGNIVFEDLVFLCDTMGLETGIDIEKLKKPREIAVQAMTGEAFHGAIAKAGPPRSLVQA